MAIREAMASGMGIVISKNIKLDSKLINDNKSGFVCPLDDNEFISAIESYINNPSLFVKHGEINKAVTSKMSISYIANEYSSRINKIIGENQS